MKLKSVRYDRLEYWMTFEDGTIHLGYLYHYEGYPELVDGIHQAFNALNAQDIVTIETATTSN